MSGPIGDWSVPTPEPTRPTRRPRSGGSSSMLAHGEPMVWLTGGTLAICLTMILGLIGAIVVLGLRTFWPAPVEQVVTFDGRVLLGEPDQSEWFRPTPEFFERLAPEEHNRARAAQSDETLLRRRLRTGNVELTGDGYQWINAFQSQSTLRPEWAIVIERFAGGRAYGILRDYRIDGKGLEVSRSPQAALALFQKHLPEMLATRANAESMEHDLVGPLNRRRADAELALKAAEIQFGLDSEPWRRAADNLAQVSRQIDRELTELRSQIDAMKEQQDRHQIVIDTPTSPEYAISMGNIVRAYTPNRMTFIEKLDTYAGRWWEFLTSGPREGNAEGGVFPALVGTLVMTILMSIAVVPLGVIAAIYLREYAKAGVIVSITRIAINNLAGVPSIVFGVFGLGFFVYVCGTTIDEIFFPIRPSSAGVFGQGGVLWASLTLALLTLPVVIVATEESLSAVPNSMREGSYACGASKWQTIRRIILPRAMPGVLTGLILAIARGAGEVAPLMLVGVASYAPELPIDSVFPFIHPERQFMHLAYSIYWTSTQSPNSEAARPLVFTMTLLLIVLIAVLNLLAIWLRSRLRRRFMAGAF